MAEKRKAKAGHDAPAVREKRQMTELDYALMERAARSLETALRVRRRYANAVRNATSCVEHSLARLMAIANGTNGEGPK